MPIEIIKGKVIIKSKLLGVRAIYIDANIQKVLKEMYGNPEEFLLYCDKLEVLALNGLNVITLGKINSKYEEYLGLISKLIVRSWKITGGDAPKYFYGLNIEIELKDGENLDTLYKESRRERTANTS